MSHVLRCIDSDPVVRRSPVDYVMQVLTPAVIMRMIMEDMGQDEGEALETMTASTALGMALNGDAD